MPTVQNPAGDSANIGKGTDPSSNHLLANTGTVNAMLSLNGAVGIANGTPVDFGSSKKTISFQVVPAGAITAGAVTLQVSSDALTWITLSAAGATLPSVGLVSLNAITATNPLVLATGGQTILTTNLAIAIRYARANVSTGLTGTGASVSVQISAA